MCVCLYIYMIRYDSLKNTQDGIRWKNAIFLGGQNETKMDKKINTRVKHLHGLFSVSSLFRFYKCVRISMIFFRLYFV